MHVFICLLDFIAAGIDALAFKHELLLGIAEAPLSHQLILKHLLLIFKTDAQIALPLLVRAHVNVAV